jgi:hypothetical protein
MFSTVATLTLRRAVTMVGTTRLGCKKTENPSVPLFVMALEDPVLEMENGKMKMRTNELKRGSELITRSRWIFSMLVRRMRSVSKTIGR